MPQTNQETKKLRIAIIEAKGWRFQREPCWCLDENGGSRKLPDLKYWALTLLLEMAEESVELKMRLHNSTEYKWTVRDDYDHGSTYAVHNDPIWAICLGWLKWKGIDISGWVNTDNKA